MAYWATDDLKIAQELARHDSTATTERYTLDSIPFGPGPQTRFPGIGKIIVSVQISLG